jgi:hypothetical protein
MITAATVEASCTARISSSAEGPARVLGRPVAQEAVGGVVRQRQVEDVAEQRAEIALVPGDAAHRQPAEADAMVGFRAADELHAPRIAARPVVGPRDLQRGVHRFRPRVREEGARHARHGVQQAPCEGEGAGMRHPERRDEVELPRRRPDRGHDARMRVAGIHAPEPRHHVEHAAPIRRDVVHALRALEQQRRVLEAPHRGEGQPEALLRRVAHRGHAAGLRRSSASCARSQSEPAAA